MTRITTLPCCVLFLKRLSGIPWNPLEHMT